MAQPEPPLLRPEFDTLLGACEDLLGRDPESPGGVDLIVENGPSERRLSYKRVTDEDGNVWGRRYLVVGGMVLARGLTIEGLVSSYFLRTTKQYDTLMQMGRWFGYRGGYDDLQRMWMPEEVSERFQNLATVEAEIREDISSYSNADDEVVRTPMDFAVRIRQMPGMLITSRNKMRSASRVQVSWSGHHVQTRRFHHRNSTWLSQNRAAAEQLLNVAGEPRYVSGGRVWLSIDAEAVADFLGSYQIHEHHVDLAQEHLLAFVEKLAEEGIDQWNVALVTPERGERAVSPFKSGPLAEVRMVNRACYDELSNGMGANIKALMSRRDLLLDVVASPHELTERVDDSWARVKVARQNALGKVPLVVLYLIDPNSVPRGWAARSDEEKENLDRTSTGFRPLEAVAPIVGLGLVFPDLGTQGGQVYVSVNLPEPEPDELDDAADEEAEEDG